MCDPPLVARETEIFVPAQLAQGCELILEELGDDDAYTYDAARQTLFILSVVQTGESGNGQVNVHKVRVRFEPPIGGELANDLWSDFGLEFVQSFGFLCRRIYEVSMRIGHGTWEIKELSSV